MPISIDPIEIEVETVTKQMIVADKLHLLSLTIKDPTREKPSVELSGLPYAEDANGNKQFGTSIVTIRTTDLYAAMPNLAAAGFTKMQDALQAVFDAASELVKYQVDCKAGVDAIKPEFDKAQADYQVAVESRDETAIKAAQVTLNDVMKRIGAAQAAVNDPANPRVAAGAVAEGEVVKTVG
jgi:hypothetical protein